MLFNSLTFWIFFAIFFPVYFALKGNFRNTWSLAASYVFYGWWDSRFLILIIIITIISYICGDRIRNDLGRSRVYLIINIVSSLGILALFKYFDFFVESLESSLNVIGIHPSIETLNVILPIGISFYTFQTLSYSIDVYYRRMDPEPSLLRFALYVAFFPQLVAGPIVRAVDFLPQLHHDQPLRLRWLSQGLLLVAWGMFIKVAVADSLAVVADPRFENPAAHSSLSLLVGVISYTFQIYGDFSGYSLMAIGLARTLGYTFNSNFERPYFATSFSGFWKRWHISLSTWLRDYLYIPLGGNRRGQLRTHLNLLATMFLGGLWHGAAWTFVAWGVLHGVALVAQRIFAPIGARLRAFSIPVQAGIALIVVQSVVVCGWILFRSPSITDAWFILHRILTDGSWTPGTVTGLFWVIKGVLLIAVVLLVDMFIEFKSPSVNDVAPLRAAICISILACLTSFLGTFDSNAFIYFQF